MDGELKINLNDDINEKKFVKFLKGAMIAIMFVTVVIICAQYINQYIKDNAIIRLVAVVVCSFFLTGLFILDSLMKFTFPVKMVFFGLDSAFMLAICIITGNSYLSMLYCIVLTPLYISVNDIKKSLIFFAVSCGEFIVAYVIGWCIVNAGASVFKSIVQIFGDLFIGLSILAVHCGITNFSLKFYRNNIQLRQALKEAEESKNELKDAYEQLSQTAVYEERNRIAKDIHDNAGHSMTTVIMQTEAAKLLIDTDPEEAKNRIMSANIQAKNALEQMRESVHLLAGRTHPKSIKSEMEEIIAQTLDGTELKIRCDIEEVPLTAEEQRFICNSLKECLANGIRHGKATAFYVEMKKSLSTVRLLISDNGCGVEDEVQEGFGLRGIREKCEALGGECRFEGEKGEGFEVEIVLPMGEDKND